MTAAPAPEPSTLVGTGGARLRSLRWAPDEPVGRVLVVHGIGEHAGRYGLLARALAARGYAVMAYDQRGHGASEGRRGHVRHFDLFIEDLDAALADAERRLAGPGAPFVVGHSMGGLILLRWLQTRRPALPGAVVSAPWLGTAVPVPAWKRLLARVLTHVAPDVAFTEPIPVEHLTRDPEEARAYEEDPLVHHRITPGLYAGAQEAQRAVLDEGLPDGLPTLLLVPGDDRVVSAERTLDWARRFDAPGLEVVELPDFRHEPFHEVGREAVFRRLADWMDGRRGGA